MDRLNAALEGRYRIERELGEGGMATVYLAEDLKHDRKVALKVLKPELAAVVGAERFLAEIKTTANLQHPHILPLFDSGEADSFLFYVMPYLEGESLRDRLDRERQLPVDEAVALVSKVADALDYAHDRGVVHRDIKPANILLSERGEPLVADFGIALAVTQAGGGRVTETGLSMGTPHYMSPEQASGDRDVDPRSDIFALGCVLYELLAGDPPFAASSAQGVLARILTEEAAPVTRARRTVPPHVAGAVAQALQRLPADRFGSARAFARALADPGFRFGEVAGAAAGTAPLWNRLSVLMTALAVLFAGAAGWSLVGGEARAPGPVTRVVLTSAPGQELGDTPGAVSIVAVSPDGGVVAYRGADTRLWTRRLDELAATPIPGTEGVVHPRFSDDGASLSFQADEDDRLGVVPTGGGVPVWLQEPAFAFGTAWGDDGAIYWIGSEERGSRWSLRRWLPGAALAETVVDSLPPGGVSDVLPGSRVVLLTGPGGVHALELASGTLSEIGPGVSARYLDTGHLVFAREEDGALLIQPFSPRSLTVTGPAVTTGAVVRVRRGRVAEFSIGDEGTLVYRPALGGGAGERLVRIEPSGQVEPVQWPAPGSAVYDGISLDPSGTRAAVAIRDGRDFFEGDIWIIDLDAGAGYPLTTDGSSVRPDWHPSEERLAFIRHGDGPPTARWIAADGSGREGHLADLVPGLAEVRWIPGRDDLVVRMSGETSIRSIFRLVLGDEATLTPWLDNEFSTQIPVPSPDGAWLLYTSGRTGRQEIYARPWPDGGAVTQLSSIGASRAVWAPDGDAVYFDGSDGYMWQVDVTPDGDRLRIDGRERLFEYSGNQFAMGSDGRFLAALSEGTEEEDELILVRNWVQEVRGRE